MACTDELAMSSMPANDHASLYAKLPTRDPWIRLLRLQPAYEPSAGITCTLEEHSLQSTLKYRALSYAWNQDILSTQNEHVEENQISLRAMHQEESTEHIVTITKSLGLALRRLRKTDRPTTLWIDSLCINQLDDDERTSQVGLMAMIYRFAEEVIIWLGEKESEDDLGGSFQANHPEPVTWSDNNASRALVDQYIENYEAIRKTNSDSMRHKRDVFGAFCLIWFLSQGQKTTQLPFHHASSYTNEFQMGWAIRVSEGFRAVMERNWWRRAWVVQETVLASKATIVYSTLSAPWSMFANAAKFHLQQQIAEDFDQHRYLELSRITRTSDPLDEFCGTVLSFENTRQELSLQHPVQLLTLLRRYRSRKATDERDKVFSLLGLVDQWMRAPIGITYSMDVGEVYSRTTLHVIEEMQSLSILCDARSTSQLESIDVVRAKHDTLLSWIPHWSQTSDNSGLDLERILRFEDYAAGSARGHAYLHSDSILETKGAIIGTIKAIAPVVPGDAVEQLRQVMSRWEQWWLTNTSGRRHDTSVFWGTVCGGCLYKPDKTDSRQSPYTRASLEEIKKAQQAWLADTTTKRNRKTVFLGGAIVSSYKEPKEVTRLKNSFYYSVRCSTVSRCFFTFERNPKKSLNFFSRLSPPNANDIGIGPENLQVGDVLFIPQGSKVPLVVRSKSALGKQLPEPQDKLMGHQGQSHETRRLIGSKENAISQCSDRHELHTLVGDAYVNGFMFAEDFAHDASEAVKVFLQ